MITPERVQELSDRIVQEFHPERIVLFGSYAYGTPTPTSDLDLLVVLPFQGKGAQKALEILRRTNPTFSVDMIVRTPEQVHQRVAQNDFFLREILEKGKVLDDATHR